MKQVYSPFGEQREIFGLFIGQCIQEKKGGMGTGPTLTPWDSQPRGAGDFPAPQNSITYLFVKKKLQHAHKHGNH